MIEVIPSHNGLERIKIYSLEKIFRVISREPKKNYWQDGEYKIKVARAKVFHKKGLTCINCGKELEVFDDDHREISCEDCGYTNEFVDNRVEFYEREV